MTEKKIKAEKPGKAKKGLIVEMDDFEMVWYYYWTMEDLKKKYKENKEEPQLSEIEDNSFFYIDKYWVRKSFYYLDLDYLDTIEKM